MADEVYSDIASLLHLVIGQAHDKMGRRAADMGLSRQEYILLRMIRLEQAPGRAVDTEHLSGRVNLPPVSIDRTAARLVERGYLAESGALDPAWELTPEGERLTGPLGIMRETLMLQMTSGLTAEELDVLTGFLRRVIGEEPGEKPA